MTERRDVLVIGAGPAGATAAALLARGGADVLGRDRSIRGLAQQDRHRPVAIERAVAEATFGGSLEVGAESAADHQRADAGDDGSTPHPNAPEGGAEGPTAQPTTSLRLDAGQLDVQL